MRRLLDGRIWSCCLVLSLLAPGPPWRPSSSHQPSLSGRPAAAESFRNLGVAAFQRGDLDGAERYLQTSLAISTRRQPVGQDAAETLYYLAKVAFRNGALEEARDRFQQALHAAGPGGAQSPLTAHILNNLGHLALACGDLVLAEDYLRRSLALKSKLEPESLSFSDTLENLGGVAELRGDLDSAEEYFEKSLRLRVPLAPGSEHVARSLSELGVLAQERGDSGAAARHLRDSLSIYARTKPDDPAVGRSLISLGDLAAERGDLAAAEENYNRSLALRRRLVASKRLPATKISESLDRLGEIALRRGDLKAAERSLREALAIDGGTLSTDWLHVQVLQALAVVLRRTGRLQEAARTADLSIEALESQIDKLGGSQETKGRFRAQRGDVYRDALRLQVELGHPHEAFHLLERFRAQAFLALLAERDLTFAAGLSPELDRERRRLTAAYDRNELRRAELDPEKDGKAIEALQREQAVLRRQRDEIAGAIRRSAPRLATLQNARALSFEQVRAALDPGTVMLSWSIGEETSHLFIVAPGQRLRVETLDVGRQTLEEEVGRFRRLVVGAPTRSSLGAEGLGWFGRRLYRQLVEPAERWIAAGNRIVLVPDGPLHLLPFAALIRGDGRYLVDWKPLSTVLSGTVYAELKKQRREPGAVVNPSSSEQLVAFGDPWFPPRLARGRPEDIGDAGLRALSTRGQFLWQRLPQARREVEEIAALFPAGLRKTWLDRAATEERAKAVGKEARIVHFATHGFIDDRSPFDSGLVLSIPEKLAEGRDNGLLQVWEIFESLRLDADLVVLSACDTGNGEIRGGEGIIGLTRAFQYAGARSVLASLWSVEDRATAELMQRFYLHLRAGKPKDEALREAQLELIRHPLRVPDGGEERNASAPFFWAALQLVGDGR